MQRFGLRRKNKPTKNGEDEVSQSLDTVSPITNNPKIVEDEEPTIDQQPLREKRPTSQSEKIVEETEKEIPEVIADKTTITKSQEIDIVNTKGEEKIVCPHCQKKFGTPLYTLEFNDGKSKTVRCCPYCFKSVDKNHKTNKVAQTKKESAKTADDDENKLNFVVKTEELDEVLKNYRYLK